ncbi:MAG: DNA polymerase III subunit delta [Candidatus Midichloria sp.]|nr:DNA polymerase III subunit delta [Candidatus Midichloria sp.]
MKSPAFTVDSEKVEGFLTNHKGNIVYSLVYGSDEGAIRIVREKLISRFLPSKEDKIHGLQSITYNQLISSLATLNDFFCSNSLFAEKKLLLIENCSENLNADIVKILQKNTAAIDSAVLFIAGEVRKNSRIVKSLEAIYGALIVPCYKPDYQAIVNIIRNWLMAKKIPYEDNLQTELASIMPSNRLLIERELEKLALYCSYQKLTVSAIAELFANYSAESSLEDLANAFFTSNIKKFLKEITIITDQGYNNIFIIRALQNYATRLKQVKELLNAGKSLNEALLTLTPPLFFKNRNRFLDILKSISLEQINNYLYNLLLLESSIKKDGMSDKDIYTIHSLCRILRQRTSS